MLLSLSVITTSVQRYDFGHDSQRCCTQQVGDQILSVDEHKVVGEPLGVLRGLILGPQGTFVKLTFHRRDHGEVHFCVRAAKDQALCACAGPKFLLSTCMSCVHMYFVLFAWLHGKVLARWIHDPRARAQSTACFLVAMCPSWTSNHVT
jgi:hypothetical protein